MSIVANSEQCTTPTPHLNKALVTADPYLPSDRIQSNVNRSRRCQRAASARPIMCCAHLIERHQQRTSAAGQGQHGSDSAGVLHVRRAQGRVDGHPCMQSCKRTHMCAGCVCASVVHLWSDGQAGVASLKCWVSRTVSQQVERELLCSHSKFFSDMLASCETTQIRIDESL